MAITFVTEIVNTQNRYSTCTEIVENKYSRIKITFTTIIAVLSNFRPPT